MAGVGENYELVSRYMKKLTVVYYGLVSSGGVEKRVTPAQMAYLVGRGRVVNVTAQMHNGSLIFRGKGVDMTSLPVIQVKDEKPAENAVDKKEESKKVVVGEKLAKKMRPFWERLKSLRNDEYVDLPGFNTTFAYREFDNKEISIQITVTDLGNYRKGLVPHIMNEFLFFIDEKGMAKLTTGNGSDILYSADCTDTNRVNNLLDFMFSCACMVSKERVTSETSIVTGGTVGNHIVQAFKDLEIYGPEYRKLLRGSKSGVSARTAVNSFAAMQVLNKWFDDRGTGDGKSGNDYMFMGIGSVKSSNINSMCPLKLTPNIRIAEANARGIMKNNKHGVILAIKDVLYSDYARVILEDSVTRVDVLQAGFYYVTRPGVTLEIKYKAGTYMGVPVYVAVMHRGVKLGASFSDWLAGAYTSLYNTDCMRGTAKLLKYEYMQKYFDIVEVGSNEIWLEKHMPNKRIANEINIRDGSKLIIANVEVPSDKIDAKVEELLKEYAEA